MREKEKRESAASIHPKLFIVYSLMLERFDDKSNGSEIKPFIF